MIEVTGLRADHAGCDWLVLDLAHDSWAEGLLRAYFRRRSPRLSVNCLLDDARQGLLSRGARVWTESGAHDNCPYCLLDLTHDLQARAALNAQRHHARLAKYYSAAR